MPETPNLVEANEMTTTIIGGPFEWRAVPAGIASLADFSQEGGTIGGEYLVSDFWMAKFLITNQQYQSFCDAPDGFGIPNWWNFSPQARQWHADHSHPRSTAFIGNRLPRTRVSWFDSMAFCAWLSSKWTQVYPSVSWVIRLPTEMEWQRAAVGDTAFRFPWGDTPDPLCANFQGRHGQPTPVDQHEIGKSPFGVVDMAGNLWEWCLTTWGRDDTDLNGYVYRVMRGGAWNTRRPEDIGSRIRYGHSPRGQLNDAGFRIAFGRSV